MSVDHDAYMSDFDEPQIESLTLNEFVFHAKELLDAKEMDEFSKFVLTGVYNNKQHQVDPIKDTLQDDHEVVALRDYDSLLGLHPDICVRTYLTVYPVSKFEDTLRRNVHIKYSFTNSTGEYTDIPIHRIPNLCVAKWGTHNMIRVLFPGLYNNDRRSPFLTQPELALFYEHGLRPAVVNLAGAGAAEWPPTYSAEMFRARGKNGTLSFQTKTLPDWVVEDLGDSIRTALSSNGVLWGGGLLFLHQIRGIKASNGHTPTRDAASQALREMLAANDIMPTATLTGDWWIDVGLELASQQQQCLAWRTDSHFHIVKDVLDIPSNKAHRITQLRSSKYLRDMTSHLTAVSGCRISPGVQAQGPHAVLYLQMYTTDKSITYRPDGTHFGKFLKGEDIIKGKADDYCHDLYELYREATNKNFALGRIEVRVPLSNAAKVLVDVNVNPFRNGLVSFEPVIWWSLRAYRALAFKHILAQQARGTGSLRSTDNALLLTAAAPWFLNGLHSVPDNGPCSRDLMGKILPHVNRVDADMETLAYPASTRARVQQMPDAEDSDGELEQDLNEDNISVASDLSDAEAPPAPIPRPTRSGGRPETLPYNPYGIVFLRDIRIGNGTLVPRFQDITIPMITSRTFRYIFGVDRDEVDTEFFKTHLSVPANPLRVANRTHRTAIRFVEEEEAPIFHLSQSGYQLPPPIRDEGSDIELGEQFDEEDEDVGIDQKLTDLWRQFLVDVTAKVPNRKDASESSYCKLSKLQRDRVNDATYQNLRLRQYFSDCQFKKATKQQWDAAFDKFWPKKGSTLVGKTQNFLSMTYYLSWGKLLSTTDEETATEMRKVLHKRFVLLKWIPNVQSDRVWYTSALRTFQRLPESSASEAAPRILLRWDVTPIL